MIYESQPLRPSVTSLRDWSRHEATWRPQRENVLRECRELWPVGRMPCIWQKWRSLVQSFRMVSPRQLTSEVVEQLHTYVPDGKAETIEEAIVAYLQKAGIHMSAITSFGSDGASVMVGSSSGVATRLKRLNPQMLSIHCMNHRLALATITGSRLHPFTLFGFKKF